MTQPAQNMTTSKRDIVEEITGIIEDVYRRQVTVPWTEPPVDYFDTHELAEFVELVETEFGVRNAAAIAERAVSLRDFCELLEEEISK